MENVDGIRMLAAFFVGYFLTLSGSLCQLTTNNPLASPSTLGMDGLGVVSIILAQVLILFFNQSFSLEYTALFLFSLLFMLIGALSFELKPRKLWQILDLKMLVLMGLSFNLLVGAIFSVIQFLFIALNFEFPTGLWFGNLKHASSHSTLVMLMLFSLSLFYVMKNSSKFNLLNLGASMAQGLGLQVEKFQKQNLLISLLMTGLVIAFFGVFSFIGLIVPHILRSLTWFKFDMRREIIIGPFLGGMSILLIDIFCFHFTFYGAELPVGMISSVIGSFLLIYLVLKKNWSNF